MSNNNYTITNNNDGSQQYVDHAQAWQLATDALHSVEDNSQKQKIMSGYLQGIRGEIATAHMDTESLGAYSKTFKDVYTREERLKQISTKGSQLWKKKKNAEAIEKQEKERREKMRERADKAVKKGGFNFRASSPGLIALSAFMGGNTRYNTSLLRTYDQGDKGRVLQECIREFMTLDLDHLDLRSDKKAAENAEKLEKFSERFSGIQYLVTTSSDAYAMLSEDLRASFEKYYGKANTVVTQYRLKKLVMTDSYYVTHENREIGTSLEGKLSASQLNLAEMIWQYNGGLGIFLNRSDDYYKNGTLKGLNAALRRDGVGKDRLSLQDRLRKRREELEKRGLAARMDDFIWRERHIDIRGKLGVTGHARNLTACKLTGDPDKDLALLPEIMDQRDVIEKTGQLRKDSKNSYYMEQSDFQISLADASINMLSCLKRMEQDLLIIGRLSRGGALDVTVTQDQIELCRARYVQDLAEYNKKMQDLKTMRTAAYVLQPDQSPENAEYAEKNGENNAENKDPVSEAKELISSLTASGFSDLSIYLNRNQICALSKKCKGTEVSGVLDVISKKAVALWKAKRLLNVNKALQSDKDNAALKAEAEGLKAPEKDDTAEAMTKLRAEAEKKQFDFQDLKAQASHYTCQYDWAVNSKGDGGRGLLLSLCGVYYNHVNKKFGSDRELEHGEAKYDEAVLRLQQLPAEITGHQDGTPLLLQKGDADVPAIDITKYYEDSSKDALKVKIGEIKAALEKAGNDYPEELKTALEAMEHYVKIKYIVTTETTEMEMAFLDKFQKDLYRAFTKMKKVNPEDAVTRGMLDIMLEINTLGRGKLRDKDNPDRITDAEFEAAIEQPAIHTMSSENDLTESNVKDIPLFTHKPNLNDIKQGYVGDCYFMAAVTTFLQSNPDGIMNMFYDIGDGNVLVRLYMGFDENNRRVDTDDELRRPEVTMRPVYIKVRKDYDLNGTAHDCMWVQLLEKAYVSTGAQHKTMQVDPATGRLQNFITEISGGMAPKILMHLTGRKDCWDHDRPEHIDPQFSEKIVKEYQMRSMLSGVPEFFHDVIWDEIKNVSHEQGEEPDAWENKVLNAVRDKIKEFNDFRELQIADVKNSIIRDIPDVSLEDLATVEKKILELFLPDPDAVAEQVRKNLHTEAPDLGDGTGLMDPSFAISSLYDSFMNKVPVQSIISRLSQKVSFYEPIEFTGTEKEIKATKELLEDFTRSRNKAMTEYNPADRYTPEEMIFLHDVRAARKRNEGMHFGVFGHAMDILDVELKAGRWYLLVRDTNNIRNYSYERNSKGNLVGVAGKNSFDIKNGIRRLDGNLTTGVRGTSWWELKTIFGKMYSYGNSPKVH